ncbi:T9SS type A sorting domain-containing protein [Flavobacteriales bacterium]|nr:T9SS type A sorting domain-containing protein [Flavobacteriales bacterium]
MKKNYIGILALALCSTGIAQDGVFNTTPLVQKTYKGNAIQAATPLYEKGIELWSNDMSNAGDWTITNTSVPTTNEWVWTTDPTTPAGLGDFASSTVANGFFLVNSDGAPGNTDGDGTPIVTDLTIATPIDLSATNTVTGQAEMFVTLTVEHNFRWWQDIREVHVSGDGGANWTIFPISDANGNVSGAMDQNSGNPEVTTVNISSVAGGSNNVLVRLHYDDQDFWGWYWAVDDIKINVQDANDLAEVTSYFGSGGLPYFSIPTSQIAPIDFYSVATNAGAADQTNAIVTVDVNAGTFTGTSAGMTLAQGLTDTLNVTAQYTPAAVAGSHAVTYAISADLADDSPLDNGAMDSFDVVAATGTYGRDRGVYEAQGGGEDNATPGDFAFEAGNTMEIFADQQAYGIDVVIGANTPAGTIIYGKLYIDDGAGGFQYLDETAEYTTTQADADNNETITLVFFTLPTLTATQGIYYPMVGCYSEFYYGTSGESEEQTSWIMYPSAGGAGSQYYTTSSPMVRLNFDPSIGVTENVVGNMELGQNIPNPFNNTTAINYSVASNANVTLTVVDMTGKVVLTVNEGTKAAGDYKITLDASTLAGGMYHYTLSNGATSITKAMSVVK